MTMQMRDRLNCMFKIRFKIVQLPLPSNEKCCEILFKNAFIDMKLDEVKSYEVTQKKSQTTKKKY